MTTSSGDVTYQQIVNRFAFDRLEHVVDVLTKMYTEGLIESFDGVVFFRAPEASIASTSFDFTQKIILSFIEDKTKKQGEIPHGTPLIAT